ncbi:MAG: Gfo/Idh/MocA family oxidoreductase [Anaerolineae bacterium]|nr:Gfo/Idh/MocA family oxidoreductase [Anaerolineae bacterium]
MKTFTVGLVGCGHISVTHLQAWQKTAGCQVVGVSDLSHELAQKRMAEFNIPTLFPDLDTLIAACDVVDICTPPQVHAWMAEKVIAAGKHLIIEKPLVTAVADWEKLKANLRQSGQEVTVIHNLKFSHSVQQAKKWLDEGRIGQVIRIRREFLTSPSSDRMLVGNGHWSHQLPGGRWFETLPHELYLTHYFAGPLALDAVSIIHTEQAPAGASADEVVIVLKDGRSLATIHFSANCEQNRRVFTVQGSEGMITVDILSDFATLATLKDQKNRRVVGRPLLEAGQTALRAFPDRTAYLQRRRRKDTPHSHLIQQFGHYLQGQAPPPTPLAEVDYVVRYCDQIGQEIERQLAEMRKMQNDV